MTSSSLDIMYLNEGMKGERQRHIIVLANDLCHETKDCVRKLIARRENVLCPQNLAATKKV